MGKLEKAAGNGFLEQEFQPDRTSVIGVSAECENKNDSGYSFVSRPDQDTEIRIVPKAAIQSHAAVFEENIPEKERFFYRIAIHCGLLTDVLTKELSAYKFNPFDPEQDVAFDKSALIEGGKKRNDCHGSNENDRNKSILSGLLLAMLTQFSGKEYWPVMDDAADIEQNSADFWSIMNSAGESGGCPVPDCYVIGDSKEDKIQLAVMYWLFYTCKKAALQGKDVLQDTVLPDTFRELIGSLSPLFLSGRDRAESNAECIAECREEEKQYSEWLGEMIVRSREDGAEGMELVFLLQRRMGYVCKEVFPAALNNCLLRAVYIFCTIRAEAEKGHIASFQDIFTFNQEKLSSYEHHILKNMCLLSSGAFEAVNICQETQCTIPGFRKTPDEKTAGAFEAVVKIDGIGSFCIGLENDTGTAAGRQGSGREGSVDDEWFKMYNLYV